VGICSYLPDIDKNPEALQATTFVLAALQLESISQTLSVKGQI